jgi:hypothetical protein
MSLDGNAFTLATREEANSDMFRWSITEIDGWTRLENRGTGLAMGPLFESNIFAKNASRDTRLESWSTVNDCDVYTLLFGGEKYASEDPSSFDIQFISPIEGAATGVIFERTGQAANTICGHLSGLQRKTSYYLKLDRNGGYVKMSGDLRLRAKEDPDKLGVNFMFDLLFSKESHTMQLFNAGREQWVGVATNSSGVVGVGQNGSQVTGWSLQSSCDSFLLVFGHDRFAMTGPGGTIVATTNESRAESFVFEPVNG